MSGSVRIEPGTGEPERFRRNWWNRRLEPEPVEPELEPAEPGFGTGTGGTRTGTVRTDLPYGPSVRTVRTDRPDRPYGRESKMLIFHWVFNDFGWGGLEHVDFPLVFQWFWGCFLSRTVIWLRSGPPAARPRGGFRDPFYHLKNPLAKRY